MNTRPVLKVTPSRSTGARPVGSSSKPHQRPLGVHQDSLQRLQPFHARWVAPKSPWTPVESYGPPVGSHLGKSSGSTHPSPLRFKKALKPLGGCCWLDLSGWRGTPSRVLGAFGFPASMVFGCIPTQAPPVLRVLITALGVVVVALALAEAEQ